ncbi:DNA-binding transcriptional regulator [Brevundimonas sp. SORGH_AS_0993]|uniref:helix-turn-helix domain-containing protein n=1 Tax=Brevundimonas sp. SORGH_AS_0993 TaxID=3041794 RepID=UPI00278A05E3|nr:helix-turn-helix transcriptional regulator [Brevundimonas sp. SORGH_AS_0993]MDQ1153046.1 transcriptional regulator with XRE-family HTH domain [Brevundimonas sp. SORGH_AS_0993]
MPELLDLQPDELRTFRQNLDLTQAELAEKLGGSRRSIEDWEAGRRQPPAMLRLALAALRFDVRPWSPITIDPRYPDRESVENSVRDRLHETASDRAQTKFENWLSDTASLPLAEAILLGFLETATDGYNDIEWTESWDRLPKSGWRTTMVVKPVLGNGLHPNVAFETRHDEHARRLAVFVDSKRPNERLPGRLRVEQALVDQGFRVMTFSGEEILADPEGCIDRITGVLMDLVDENLVAAGIIGPPKRKSDMICPA